MVFRKNIEELVCLQLIGLSPKQILEMNKNSVYDIISHAENTYKKATQIIKEQVEAGVDFAKQGHPIVSGLALGCDTAAHRGCLDAGGQTVAIVASGLNLTHPKENKSLQEEIIRQGGLILSEHPFGVKANPTRLVARCRMQVVLSRQVIVAQCPIVSGTMYAVHFAREYDGDIYGWENEVYAVAYDSYDEKSSWNQFLL